MREAVSLEGFFGPEEAGEDEAPVLVEERQQQQQQGPVLPQRFVNFCLMFPNMYDNQVELRWE